ncbi:hypothetical protein [Aeromonas sp. sia0103]|nr:hypothetical protein [Aeromonas sp. sia0103]
MRNCRSSPPFRVQWCQSISRSPCKVVRSAAGCASTAGVATGSSLSSSSS